MAGQTCTMCGGSKKIGFGCGDDSIPIDCPRCNGVGVIRPDCCSKCNGIGNVITKYNLGSSNHERNCCEACGGSGDKKDEKDNCGGGCCCI